MFELLFLLLLNVTVFSINKVKVEVKVHIYIQIEPTVIASYVTCNCILLAIVISNVLQYW